MAICPFAIQKPYGTTSGPYTGGPFRIIHHTTEGKTAQSAFDTYALKGQIPHFTVDAMNVYQQLDTRSAARALNNPKGGVETNKQSAVQIEVVGYAGARKDRATLMLVARLCRWIEKEHGVPNTWPNGHVKPHRDGKDPGGHDRNVANWKTKGGHYGHSQVPENYHWDPAYSEMESEFIRTATFGPDGAFQGASEAVNQWLLTAVEAAVEPEFTPIEDHGDIPLDEQD